MSEASHISTLLEAVRHRSKWPSPFNCRLPKTPNGARPVNWRLVDPYLQALMRGQADAFARVTGISLTTIRRRMNALGIVNGGAGK